jgi:hypothetical protein
VNVSAVSLLDLILILTLHISLRLFNRFIIISTQYSTRTATLHTNTKPIPFSPSLQYIYSFYKDIPWKIFEERVDWPQNLFLLFFLSLLNRLDRSPDYLWWITVFSIYNISFSVSVYIYIIYKSMLLIIMCSPFFFVLFGRLCSHVSLSLGNSFFFWFPQMYCDLQIDLSDNASHVQYTLSSAGRRQERVGSRFISSLCNL